MQEPIATFDDFFPYYVEQLWSFRADFTMYVLALRGRMGPGRDASVTARA